MNRTVLAHCIRALGVCAAALAVAALLPAAAPADPPSPAGRSLHWEATNGPEGAWVISLVSTPGGSCLAGLENGGVYRSVDGGQSWFPSDYGIEWPCCNYTIPSLAASGSAVYAGTWGGGVIRSADDGASWSPTSAIPGDPYSIVTSLACCFRGDRVYAGGNFGVAVSQDGGDVWESIGDGLPPSWVRGLALRGTTLYAMLDQGIYRLDPGASSWIEWNMDLPSTNGMQSIRATADALYLATHEGGVCHLDCADSAWVFMNGGLWDDNVDAVVEVDQTLYAGTMGSGLFEYDAQSATWWNISAGLWNGDIRALARRGRHVVAGTFGGGPFRYDTEFAEWSEASTGMVAPMVTSLAHDAVGVYAGLEGGGVFRSTDQGGAWTRSLDGFETITVLDLATEGDAIYAATWNGVVKSTDHADTWSPAGLQGTGVFCLDSWSSVLYAGSHDGHVWASVDGGEAWNGVGTGLPNAIVRGVVRLGASLYAAMSDGGVLHLADGETTWTAMNDGLPQLYCDCLCAMGSDLYVGTGTEGVWKWDPDAAAWISAGLPGKTIFCLTAAGTTLMAGCWGELFKSEDGGASWTLDNDGLKPWLPVRAVSFTGDAYYAGLGNGGVWRAENPMGIAEPDRPALSSAILGVRPNPVVPGSRIFFDLEQSSRVVLTIHDSAGRRIAALHDGFLPAGRHERIWDGRLSDGARAPAGLYLIRLESGGVERTAKVIRID